MLPGIFAALIVDNLTVHKGWDNFRFPLYSLLLGIVCYLFMQAVLEVANVILDTKYGLRFWGVVGNDAKSGDLHVDFRELFAAMLVSIFLGITVSAIINKKIVHRLASELGITEKYGDESLFYFFLNSPDVGWVRVTIFAESKVYEGYRESFSDSDGVREVLLRDVNVYRLQDSALLYHLDSAYLSSNSESFVIEKP